ncbi:acyl carrier protein [bacterium]|nr:acyl carrier protein [bacterium]MBU1627404.1 acyl carrier protein [bacterium]
MTVTRAWRDIVKETGIDFPVVRIFENPTISGLAKFLSKSDIKDIEYENIQNNVIKQKETLRNRRAIRGGRVKEMSNV